MVSRQRVIGANPVAPDTAVTTSAYMGRLSRQQMALLDSQFPPRATDNPTVAAQYLGQQQVLAKLRAEFSE